ncbi:MAG: redoxin domain-containing protein [Bacteroidales bacterium]|nr:redoxin domain-containing protein [Candidatus Cacconaster scatequi]
MKKLLLIILSAAAIVSCSKGPQAAVSAVVEGAEDSSVVLCKLNFNKFAPVDTIKTDASGAFKCKISLTGNEPYFYYLFFADRQVAALILKDGDKVSVKASTVGGYSVEGSEESNLFIELNGMFGRAAATFSTLAKEGVTAREASNAAALKEINKKLSRTYVDYRKEATRFVLNHPFSITSAVALFQKFNDNLAVFDEPSDLLLFRRVCDSLTVVYPKSEYISSLNDEISRREAVANLNNKISSLSSLEFPELALPDINGTTRQLSELKGNVVVLSFWSTAQDEHKMFNKELVELYDAYHKKGLEVYQVSLDIDKPSWAATVKSQELPWINVNDGLGIESPAVAAYNLVGIPSLFVINRDGDIVARDEFDPAKLEQIVVKSLK